MRYAAIIAAAITVIHIPDFRALRDDGAAESGQNVILVVADGLRWQEVFRGADPGILAGAADVARLRDRYWRDDAGARRRALMPFVWSTMAGQGMLLGNRDLGSQAIVTNPMKFSYPGYNELLVGYPDARIDRNDFGPNPNVTVFEWLSERREFDGKVAVFGMWDTFHDIFNVGRSELAVRDFATDEETFRAALGAMRTTKPRAMFVGFGSTDDYAHKERYDLVLDAAHAIDGYVAMLWREAQSIPQYRGRTTIIMVTDHGRGRTPRDWMHHNSDVAGSEETWFAVIGPHIDGQGEVPRRVVTLSQAAASVAAAVELDYRRAIPRAAPSLVPLTLPLQARR